ncbi:hypothetical protein E1B28_004881 [Marasmius oreades]|uniref:Thioesterase domain-containing protein n=1 Tax=Marasmius oreades TaxID=181124 RepID=A0A9P8ADF5_9AGAR|nr:uncharacterized protein E1B28_004881 [Marasmius oreades]KAG7097542.1 hypothetical protein E1B28_004881 [Marasmius oreades]
MSLIVKESPRRFFPSPPHPRSMVMLPTRSNPPAERSSSQSSDIDVSEVRGNISDEGKRLVLNIISYFIGSQEGCFGASVGERLKLIEAEVVAKDGKASQGRTVFEIKIDKDMCNSFGTLHGACATYLVGPCTMTALGVLGAALGIDGTGVSQSVNIVWHQPAKMGAKLRVISTSVFIKGHIRTSHCELWDKERDILYISATHSTVNNFRSSPNRSKL